MKTRSIAFRLIAAVLAVELVSAVLVCFVSYGYERHTHFRSFDVMLRGRADSVLGAVQDAEDPDDNVRLYPVDLHLPPDDIYEVYDASGRLLGRSQNWQGTTAQELTQNNSRDPSGDSHMRMAVDGRRYRALIMHGSRVVDPGHADGGVLRKVTILYGAPTGPMWHAIEGAVEFYAAGGAVLLLITGPLIAWLLHRGLLPLRQLAALAGRVSVNDWQFSPPESARLTPELAPLTAAMENVLKRLENSFQMQRAFVSDAAHELKTAVAVVKSSMQVLDMRPRSADEYHAGLARCLADTERLEEIVAQMLALAREESGVRTRGAEETADLGECLRRAAAQLESVATLRGVKVTVKTAADEMFPVHVAGENCAMLISNLLLNAVQHSPAGSAIEARIAVDGEAVKLEIEDRGEGIDAAALPHIFDRFYRGDPSRTRNTGGTGLGLAIAKAIVEKAGGTISAASQPGEGATFTVRLPLAARPVVEPVLSSV